MISLCLVGKDILHSRSKEVYQDILDKEIQYALIDCKSSIEIPSLSDLFKQYQGVSVTSPYKRHFFDKVTTLAEIEQLGAVNCIKKDNGKYYGTNTDYYAVKEIMDIMLERHGVTKIKILGDGVMSRITQMVAKERNIPFAIFSRRMGDNMNLLNLGKIENHHNGVNLVINTCSRSYEYRGNIRVGDVFWDYNYSVDFLPKQSNDGAIVYYDGMDLLRTQARYALSFWQIPN